MILAIIVLLIWLLVGWYLGRTYYSGTYKTISWIFVVLVSFVTAWLALKYSDVSLWDVRSSSALWTGFIISSIIALISLLMWGNAAGCDKDGCGCATGWACSVSPTSRSHTTTNKVAKAAATTVASKKPSTTKSDNLKKIEGIGPVIETHLNSHGIYTFEQLADAESVHLRSLLDSEGDRFSNHHPDTRPAQAALARDEQWDKLKTRQDELDGGRVK